MIMGLLVFGCMVLVVLGYWVVAKRRYRVWLAAAELHDQMFRELLALSVHNRPTAEEWESWLPIFQYMDDYYERHNYDMIPQPSLGDMVRNQIARLRGVESAVSATG